MGAGEAKEEDRGGILSFSFHTTQLYLLRSEESWRNETRNPEKFSEESSREVMSGA